jgi:hypothetical protein
VKEMVPMPGIGDSQRLSVVAKVARPPAKIGAMVESAQATRKRLPRMRKPDRPSRESDQACGGRKAGKVRRPQLGGNGDGGERHPSGDVPA